MKKLAIAGNRPARIAVTAESGDPKAAPMLRVNLRAHENMSSTNH